MTAPVEIQLLGGFTVRLDGREVTSVDFERRSGAELVQLLALAPNRRMHREQVIDRLWPDLSFDSGVNQFHKASTFARKGLGERTAVVIRDEIVHLFPDRDVVADIDVVDRARIGDPTSIDAARLAYRGDLLPDTPFAQWAFEEREQRRVAYLRLLESVEAWEEVVALDPCHESGHVALMQRSLEAGDRAAVMRRFDELAGALFDQVGVEPGPAAVSVRDRALASAPVAPGRTDPAPPVAGREHECEQVMHVLGTARMVTVTGPGGIGKTHLVDAVADRIADRLAAEVVEVSLGRTDDGAGAGQEFLRELGAMRQTDTGVLESIARTIGTRSLLVVVDNCEHLLEAVRPILEHLLDSCPQIRILATSRRAIECDAEHVVRLGPLPADAARDLFVAEAARHGVVLGAEDPLVARVCELVDRLPLAIRLAAARTRSVDLGTLAQLLMDDLAVIDARLAGHDRTLRESVGWSIEALSPDSRHGLESLATFAEGFDLDAALEVLPVDRNSGLFVIDDLVAASLVSVDPSTETTRYRLPEAIRFFVRTRGLQREDRRRHVAHVVSRIERAHALLSIDSVAAIAAYRAVWNDVPLAIARAGELDEPTMAHRIIAGCANYANSSSAFELLDWCDAALDDDADVVEAVHAEALAAWALMLVHRLDLDGARAVLGRIPAEHLDRPAVLFSRGWLCFGSHEIPRAHEVFERLLAQPDLPPILEADAITLHAVAVWNEGGDLAPLSHRLDVLASGRGPIFESQAEFLTGMSAVWTEPETALHHLDRAAATADLHRQFNLGGGIRSFRVMALGIGGRADDALAALADNLRRDGSWTVAIGGVATAALLLDGRGRPDLAVTLAAAQNSSGFVSGFSSSPIDVMVERVVGSDPELFDTWWRSGARLDARGATALAIELIERVLAAP